MAAQQLTQVLGVPAEAVFSTVTDVDRLPEWNDAIRAVLERPERLEPGAQWVVRMHAMGQSWPSRATVLEHDAARRRFRYRAQTDDGNPSYSEWTWSVAPLGAEQCEVTVSWDLQPQTFWRRTLLVRMRGRALRRREVPASLQRLADAARGEPVT